uniref:Secreted protein n=1 Tax=Theropithecus gelada TaxID=9565 RepID=A0A8D2EHY6_THEGE
MNNIILKMLLVILFSMKADRKFGSNNLKHLIYFLYHSNADNNQFIKCASQKKDKFCKFIFIYSFHQSFLGYVSRFRFRFTCRMSDRLKYEYFLCRLFTVNTQKQVFSSVLD